MFYSIWGNLRKPFLTEPHITEEHFPDMQLDISDLNLQLYFQRTEYVLPLIEVLRLIQSLTFDTLLSIKKKTSL